MNEIDPSQPVYPLRVTKCYPVPPVCTVHWTPEDWERTAYYVTEPATLDVFGETWHACGRTAGGTLLYSLTGIPSPE